MCLLMCVVGNDRLDDEMTVVVANGWLVMCCQISQFISLYTLMLFCMVQITGTYLLGEINCFVSKCFE